jgi:dipeptidase D
MKLIIVFALLLITIINSRRLNNEVRNLEPKNVWEVFHDISKIPHCSSKEAKIRDYLKNYAEKNNHVFLVDAYGNAVMKIKATPGKEAKPTIVLQSHLDMVCEKNRESTHNFETDPLTLMFDGKNI